MHEPFLPLPLPEPPEHGLGRLVRESVGRLLARLRPRRRCRRARRARESRLAGSPPWQARSRSGMTLHLPPEG